MKKKTLLKVVTLSIFMSLLFAGCEKEPTVNPVDNSGVSDKSSSNEVESISPEEFDALYEEAEANSLKWFNFKMPESRPRVAYAKFPIEDGGYVFSNRINPEGYPSLGMWLPRWGWAANLSEGVYVVPIYASAWGNNTENAIFAGRLKVEVSMDEIYVKYLMIDDNLIKRINVYLSDEEPVTSSPWRYGYTESFDPNIPIIKNIFDFEDVNGDGKIWLIAHAIVDVPL